MFLKRMSILKLLGLIIVSLTYSLAILLPLVVKYVGTYSAPTAVYALHIINTGYASEAGVSELQRYWRSAVNVEEDFPIPSLLLSVFMAITGLPREYAMFIPLTGVASIIYFVLAYRVFRTLKNAKTLGVLLAALFYAFVTFENIKTNYVGRATLGEIFLPFFLFSVLMLLTERHDRAARHSWFIMLILFATVTSYTYYTTTLTIVVLMFLLVVISHSIHPSYRSNFNGPWLVTGILSLLLFIRNPFFFSFGKKASLGAFIGNFADYIKFMFGFESNESSVAALYYGAVPIDATTSILKWIDFAARLASMLAVLLVLYAFRPRRNNPVPSIAWSFSLVIFFSAPAEFAYLLIGPFFPFRHLIKYGSLLLSFIALYLLNANQPDMASSTTYSRCNFRFKFSLSKLGGIFLTMMILLSCIGFLRNSWYYGISKPFGYYEIKPVSKFLFVYRTTPTTITGDAYYLACIFFETALCNKTGVIAPEPLGMDALLLYDALHTGEMQELFARLSVREIDYILLIRTTKPTFGDEWGYPVMIHNFGSIERSSLCLFYNNGDSELFGK